MPNKKLSPIEITTDDFFKGHHKLQPLPEIVTRIKQIMEEDDLNIAQIAKLVSADVALSAQILKIVNSAYYGLKKEIADMKIAIAFLGINEIYRIVLTVSVINTLNIHDKKEIHNFWNRSYYTALVVKLLASRYGRYLDREELWSASLLHDLGSMIYLKFFPDHFKEIQKVSEEKKVLIYEAERMLSLPSSSTFGSLLCTYWKLPNTVKIACESYMLDVIKSVSDADANADFKRVISVGRLCTDMTLSPLKGEVAKEITQAIMALLNIDDHDFLLLMGEVRDLQHEVDKFMKTI
jgi:HD-like signal output (HDOD) protein